MPTLKTVINLNSGNLFPTPVNFTETVTETINGNHSSFQTNVIAQASSSIVFSSASASGTTGILYFYFKAASTNTDNVRVEITRNSGKGGVLGFDSGTLVQIPGAYTADTIFTVSSANVSGGTGNGLGVIAVVDNAGDVTAVLVDPANVGTGYTSGDTITILGTALGGATPTDDVDIDIDQLIIQPTAFLRISPGDVAYLPVDATDPLGIQIRAFNNSVSSPVTLQYFYGERG